MASSNGQSIRPKERGPASAATRQRLLAAAAELIAEAGWGRVTTRAVASRAGLPHGAVSYHFRGKQELLTEAALATIEQAFPIAELQPLTTLAELMTAASAWLDRDAADPVMPAVMMEAMRESARDPALRERIAALERHYRQLLGGLISAEQQRGTIATDLPPAALAVLLAAAADGLLLNVLADPELDISPAITALHALLTTQPPQRTPDQ
jgi:AcrR family transcriptional regulator